MLKHLLVFLGMVASLGWAGYRLYHGPTHYTHLSRVLDGTVYQRDHGSTSAAYLDTKDHVLLYFAASWCASCKQVTPLLIHFYTTYAPHQNFEILLVPEDRTADALRAYVRRAAIPWASVQFLDMQARRTLQAWYGTDAIPHLVLVDKRGRELASSLHGGPLAVLAALRQRWQEGQGTGRGAASADGRSSGGQAPRTRSALLWRGKAFELHTGLCGGQSPVHPGLCGMALIFPRLGFVSYRLQSGDAPRQTLLTEHAQLDLRHM